MSERLRLRLAIRRAASALVLGAALLLTACHNPSDFVLSDAKADAFVAISVSAATMPADGISRVTVSVQLAADTDPDKRSVVFTTTLGKFIVEGRKDSRATVAADSSGHASVQLESETTAGTARLTVTAGTVTRSAEVQLLALQPADAFTVDVQTFTLPADGFSKSHIEVVLKRVGASDQRQVKFETTGGMLLAPGQPPQLAQTVTADSAGLASVDLQAGRSVGGAQLTVTALGVQQKLQLQFVPAAAADVITLSADPSSAPADGFTPIRLVARINPNLDPQHKTVTFSTSSKDVTLTETSVEASGTNQATTFATSSKAGSFLASASVDGTRVDVPIAFTLALPERVQVATDASELTSGESTTVRVTLLRSNGTTPAPDLSVAYSAVTETGAPIGTFSQAGLSTGRSATAQFNLGTTTYKGRVTITAVAQGGASGSTVILVK